HLDVDVAAARAQLEAELAREGRSSGSAGLSELDDADAEALRSLGIDLDEVRARIEEQFGPGALSPGGRTSERPGRGWSGSRRRGSGRTSAPRIGFTPEAKQLIAA